MVSNKDFLENIISRFVFKENKLSVKFADKNYDFALENLQETQSKLSEIFYKHCYTKGNNLKNWDTDQKIENTNSTEKFIQNLKANNFSKDFVDVAWRLDSETEHFITATKNRTQKNFEKPNVKKADYHPKMLQINHDKEYYKPNDSFYFIFGDNMEFTAEMLCRFYFSVQKNHASELCSLVTKKLNHYEIPFQMKFMANPDWYNQRCDNAVLYVNKPFVNIVFLVLSEIQGKLENILEKDIPLFTKEIFKGFSFAESPENGQSFGLDRSRLIAYAILQNLNHLTFENALKTIEKIGFDVENLHLNIQSNYDYLF